MKTSKSKTKSLMLVLFLSVTAISTASARVCFLPDSTDCGEGDVVGSGNVDVPCQYSSCPAHNEAYQECYPERIYNNGGVNVECQQVRCKLSKSECEKQEADANNSQCCNFDSASGCYYMGKCQSLCNRNIYDSTTDLSGEDYTCTSCKDKNGTFYNCTAIEKECKDINPKYTSSCGDSQIAEEVKGVKDSKGNQCYTCKSKPIDKCVDIEATPFLDIIEPTVKTTAATKTETQTDATFRCGTGPTVETTNNNVVIDYNGRLTATTGNYITYSYDGATKKYYVIYKNSRVNNGKPLCLKNQLCSDYVSPYTTSPVYRDAYYIERAYGSYTSYASQTYCCLSGLSGRSVNELSSCKRAKTNTIQTDTAYRVNATYVCSVGETLSGTKCKKTTYTCPEGYTLDANNVCKQLTCNEGYTLQDVNGQKRCVADAYSCPTDGKYKYKLSGNQCVCDNDCTYEYVHLTKNDTGTDNYDRQRLRYGIDGEICTTKGSTREQTSSCIYSCSNGSCKCGSNDGPVCSPVGSSCKFEQECKIYRDCQYGTKCFNVIKNNPSITNGRLSGTPEWGTIYNKISNNSASCVANGVRKYETLCEGTIKEKCQGSQTFVPNGCVSDIYSDGGVYVAGAIWGNCVCPEDKGFYDTAEECKKMTGKNCTYYNFCYQTCESRGSYSTKEACLNGKDSRLQCLENNGCYYRKAVGFTITQNSPNACGGWSFYLMDADGNYVNGDGIHEAGNYSVVITGSGRLISHANVSSRQSGGGWCFGDQAENKGCEKTKLTGIHRSESKAHSFQDGMDYTISVSCL